MSPAFARGVYPLALMFVRLRESVARGELEKQIISPGELVTAALTLASVGGKERDIRFVNSVASNLPPVLVDRVQIQQVLFNLIRNAVEALNVHGMIFVGARKDGDMVRFSVVDNGTGISPSLAAGLFEPYTTSKPSGMGLGLAICRTIVEAHGGRLWHESPAEGGAAFLFTVPVAEIDNE